MLKINQFSINVDSNKKSIEINDIYDRSLTRGIKQYKRSNYIPDANCVLSLLYNSENDVIDGSCVNIVKLDSLYLNNNLQLNGSDIELYLNSNTHHKNAKSISRDNKYFAIISQEGVLSIYNLPDSIKNKRPISLEIKYNGFDEVINFKKLEIYNKNTIKFTNDSKSLVILSDDYINLLSINSDYKWNFKMQFDRKEKNIGNYFFMNYLGCASFYFQDDNIVNIVLERKNTHYIPKRMSRISEGQMLEIINQYFNSGINIKNMLPMITSTLQFYSCNFKGHHKPTEIVKQDLIELSEQPQDVLFSSQGSFLAVRLANKIHMFYKIDGKWNSSTELNITTNYKGKIDTHKFNFNRGIKMKFNDDENKLIVRIGNDKVVVYSLLDANNWEKYNIKNSKKSRVDFHDVNKVAIHPEGGYIIICDIKGNIALLQEKNKEYIFIKDISKDNILFGLNTLSFSKDGEKIVAVNNKGIKIFMPF